MVGVSNGDRSSAHKKERTSSFASQTKSSPNSRTLSPSDKEYNYPKSKDAEGVVFGNRGDGITVKNLTVQPSAHTPLLDSKKNGNSNGSGNGGGNGSGNGNGKTSANGMKGYGSNN